MRNAKEIEKKRRLGGYLALGFWGGILLILIGLLLGSFNTFGYILGIIGAIVTIGATIFSFITFPFHPIP